jgi:phosphonate transport system substrate-binding protein
MKRTGYFVLTFIIALAVIETGCRSENRYEEVDFSHRIPVQGAGGPDVSGKSASLVVAISPIYSALENFSHYNDLFDTIGRQCALSVKIIYCKNNREAYLLFAQGKADVGLIPTALYVIGRRNRLFKILVVPVIDGRPLFQAYVVAHNPSQIRTFEDLKGRHFAFTDRLSLTGYLFPLSRTSGTTDFFGKTVFAGTQDFAIDLVERGIVDGASVSSIVFNDVNRNNPEKTDHVRVIEKSGEFGTPPIVIRFSMPAAVETALRTAFMKLKSESGGWELLQILGIDTFINADDSLYASAGKFVPETIVP